MKPTFENTLEKLKLSSIDISAKCADEMRNETILFSSDIKSDHKYLWQLYQTRLNLAESSNKEVVDNIDLSTWSKTIEDLKSSNSKTTLLSVIQSDSNHYFIFWDAERFDIISLFRLKSKNSIEDTCVQYDDCIRKGLTVSAIKYIDGIMVQDWK